MFEKTICFDLDGTIADLYGVEGWLDDLIASNPRPYAKAKPLVNLSLLARYIHKLQANGWKVNVISWLSKSGTDSYNAIVTATKYKWLADHLPSVDFDEIHIVKYGTPKSTCGKGFLFDDEERNRKEWTESGNLWAYDVDNILGTLKDLITNY